MPQSRWQHRRSAGVADDIDFGIEGRELRCAEHHMGEGAPGDFAGGNR